MVHTIDLQGSHGSLVGMGPTGLLRLRDGQQEGCNCEHLVLWGQNKADMEAYLWEHFRGVPKYSWMPATTDTRSIQEFVQMEGRRRGISVSSETKLVNPLILVTSSQELCVSDPTRNELWQARVTGTQEIVQALADEGSPPIPRIAFMPLDGRAVAVFPAPSSG